MTGAIDGKAIANSATPFEALHAALRNIVESPSESIAKFRSVEALISTRLLFRPMWTRNRDGTPVNACILDDWYDGTGTMLSDVETDDAELRQARTNYNFVMLTKALEAIHYGLKAKKAYRLIVPVHFDTLRCKGTCDEYLKLAGEMSSFYRSHLVLEIYGIPGSVSPRLLAQIADHGSRLTEKVLLRVSPGNPQVVWPLGDIIWGITQDMSSCDIRNSSIRADLARNMSMARSADWKTIAFGANTLEQVHLACALGFDYVCGGAVHPVAPAPKGNIRIGPRPGLGVSVAAPGVKVAAYRDMNRQHAARRDETDCDL